MIFDRQTILALDAEEVSQAEKRWLIAKFFPRIPLPDWKRKLNEDGRDVVRWNAFLEKNGSVSDSNPYRYSHDHIVKEGVRNRPQAAGSRVTDFSGWVFSLYFPTRNKHSLSQGKDAERKIAQHLTRAPRSKLWELIYEDPLDEKATPLPISTLTVNNEPLWGAPDLVFRDKAADHVLIVERKATNRDIPSDGWPNLRAQLWAYAQIDQWRSASKITLVGEIWTLTADPPRVRSVLRWERGETAFESRNAELFDLYRGTHQLIAAK